MKMNKPLLASEHSIQAAVVTDGPIYSAVDPRPEIDRLYGYRGLHDELTTDDRARSWGQYGVLRVRDSHQCERSISVII